MEHFDLQRTFTHVKGMLLEG